MSANTANDNMENSKKHDIAFLLHCACCVLILLLIAQCIVKCVGTVIGAFSDMRIFKDLGFTHFFDYYLVNNAFPVMTVVFLCITIEFLLYLWFYRQIEKKRFLTISVVYFTSMMILHAAIWLHSKSLQTPMFPPFDTAEQVYFHYRYFANTTIMPAAIYFILSNWHALRIKR